MPVKIHSISIQNFRSLRNFAVDSLGSVTLVTGKNNSGKSTLLEAIRLLAHDGAPSVFFSILNYREESENRPDEAISVISPDDYSAFCSLFSGYPSLANCSEVFSVAGNDMLGNPTMHLSGKIAWFEEKIDPEDSTRSLVPANADLFGETNGFPALEIETLRRKRLIRIDRPLRYRRPFAEGSDTISLPCIHLDPFSSRSTAHLGTLWDSIALTPGEKNVIKALQVAASEIEAVNMIGGEGSSVRSRTAIVRSSRFDHPVPLRSFGDGVNRLFGLMLSLSCARGGILLVDEIENGLHHSILPKVWEMVFTLARELDVQIFATTHSWDCIAAFQKAASADPEDGVLLKLALNNDLVVPTVFRESELAIATRDQIELR